MFDKRLPSFEMAPAVPNGFQGVCLHFQSGKGISMDQDSGIRFSITGLSGQHIRVKGS